MSKKTVPLLALVLAALAALPAPTQVSQKKLAALGPGEALVVQESILLSGGGPDCGTEDFFIVSRTTGPEASRFFVTDKTGRKGPFDKITEAMLRKGAGLEPKPAHYEEEGSVEGIEESGARGSFSFRGKTYGPFQQLLGAQVTADKARFYALAAKDGKLHFLSSDGRDVPAAGMPEGIRTSPDGMKAVAVCRGTLTLIDGVQVDPSKIDPASFDDVYVYGIDGTKLGPLRDFGEAWFAAGSSRWLCTAGTAAYLDGRLLREFDERIDKRTFWIDDASHFAWIEKEELRFADGARYPFPVMIRSDRRAGNTSLCWISVQKNGDVLAYQRAL
jgi:hypothetical protein